MTKKFILLHDVDVTNGTQNSAVVVSGTVNAATLDDQTKQALLKTSIADLPNIKIVNRKMGV